MSAGVCADHPIRALRSVRSRVVRDTAVGLIGVWLLTSCAAPAAEPRAIALTGPASRAEPISGVDSCDELSSISAPDRLRAAAGLESRDLACLFPGPAFDVSSLGGKPTVINLWASWCGPCREEMPILQAVAESSDGDASFVGVVTRDDAASAASFLDAVGVTYPQLNDPEGGLLGELRSPGLPVTVVLRPDGSLLTTHIGPFEDEQQLTELIQSASRDG